jgi:hypothetical protein
MSRSTGPRAKKENKLYNPTLCSEISKIFFVRNLAPIPDSVEEYTFEMTNGLGFDKFTIPVNILYMGKAKIPVLATSLSYPLELLQSKYLDKLARDLGVSITSSNGKVVIMIKLSMKNDNSFGLLRLYDFINHLYLLSDMKQTIIEETNV